MAGDIDDELHGAGGGGFDVDGLDQRQEAQKEGAAFGNFPRALAAFGGNAEGEEHRLLFLAQGRFYFVRRGFVGKQGVGADFHRVSSVFSASRRKPARVVIVPRTTGWESGKVMGEKRTYRNAGGNREVSEIASYSRRTTRKPQRGVTWEPRAKPWVLGYKAREP